MLENLKQVLRVVAHLRKPRRTRAVRRKGGLLVLLWADKSTFGQTRGCTVAAAGSWCEGIKKEVLQDVLTDIGDILSADAEPPLQLDPEELCAFTDLHGPLQLLLSFQKTDTESLDPDYYARVELFLHMFSMANAGIETHLRFRADQQVVQRVFRPKVQSKILLKGQPSLFLDVTCRIQPLVSVKRRAWCRGAHPVLGGRLPLSIPPAAMDRGLFGELSLQFVTLLSPCLLQYPNLETQLTHIKILVYSPSNVPFKQSSDFRHLLPSRMGFQEPGICGPQCSSSTNHIQSCAPLSTEEQENCQEPRVQRCRSCTAQQSLSVFLFLQHNDPFTSQIVDIMATEELLEHHLEDVLTNNRQAITEALQSQVNDSLRVQRLRKGRQEKFCSAIDVILKSTISIVSRSSNEDFRMACLSSMRVGSTHELSASLQRSMRQVTLWKFVPMRRCYSPVIGEGPDGGDVTRAETGEHVAECPCSTSPSLVL